MTIFRRRWELMDLLMYLIFGLIVGVVAHMVYPTAQFGGWLGTIILGILGAFVGGLLGSSLFGVGVSGFNISSFIVAILGAMVVIFVSRRFFARA
jgi:uncharacterized membrane protein YeaQ/YmgE (transglycosylase-associated protein family)